MSMEHPLAEENNEAAVETTEVENRIEWLAEDTPRGEVPPMKMEVFTPSASETKATTTDYFTPLTPATENPTTTITTPTSTHSKPATPDSIDSSLDATHARHSQLLEPASALSSPSRPTPQATVSSLSVESTDSSATVTPSHVDYLSNTPRPPYPDQSYSALHEQIHPSRHFLPRRGGTNPHQIFTFSAAIASRHSSGARTSSNSPAVTPGIGLFTPGGPPSAPALESPESSSTYASPFLHFTHTHVPKETHVADVDVDPISGRKLINHYEIIDELGRGTHGKVKLGRDLETKDTYVAIKIVERFSKRRKLGRLGTTEDKVKKEVAILKKARHPNIVALLEVIDDPSRKKVYIVLEWVEKGEIHWRIKGPREIAVIEARRYLREKAGLGSGYAQSIVDDDEAVLREAQKRLGKQKRRNLRAFHQTKRETANDAWSNELAGDDSDYSEDERLSRVSTATGESLAARRTAGERRFSTRTSSPLPSDDEPLTRSPTHLSVSSEPEVISPIDFRRSSTSLVPTLSQTGLEGTMYGAYDNVSAPPSRYASLTSSTRLSRRGSSEALTRRALEIIDSDLDPELEYVPVMTMEQIRVAFRDTVIGLQYLHYQGIIHRDIKPPNLLATFENRVKISDFGVSHLGKPVHGAEREDISETEATDLGDEAKELAKTVGTPAFYAPELCITDPTDDPLPVTKAIDVWALGITLFCMLFARTPFVESEFVVMRQIADEEVYIPRQRLQAVDGRSKSRASSQARANSTMDTELRGELDLVYEEINDELHDLMKRLLIKDPRKRITLEEVRHHPWVLADLSNKPKWLDETDPARQSQGKKIEISNEELNDAVVPLNLVERMRSGLKKMGERIGLGTKSNNSRLRSQSLIHREVSVPPSASSSSSTISKDARRISLRGDESIFAALKASRETEHPLARVATREDVDAEDGYFGSATAGSGDQGEPSARQNGQLPRPSPPQRAATITSSVGSMRTARQSDFRELDDETQPFALPEPLSALASPRGSVISGTLGGAGRRIFDAVRDRSSQRSIDRKGPSSSVESFDQHAEPSVAIDPTVVAGQVNLPEALKDLTPYSSLQASPIPSRPGSTVASPEHLNVDRPEPGQLSRQSSANSLSSPVARGRWLMNANYDVSFDGRPRSRTAQDSSAVDWERARIEQTRRLNVELSDNAQRTPRPSSALNSASECPPSPDDESVRVGNVRRSSLADSFYPATPAEVSPVTSNTHTPHGMVSSSSDLASVPSIPSAISEASSVDLVDFQRHAEDEEKRETSSDDTVYEKPADTFHPKSEEQLDEGYTPDQENAVDTDNDEDYESSSDSDGGLVMKRRKSVAKTGSLSATPDAAAKLDHRRNTGLSIRSSKSSRSGSNNTMRRLRTRDSIDERRRPSFGAMAE